MKRLLPWIQERRYDLGGVVGAVLLAVGIGSVYWPAGVIATGLGLIAWAFLGARVEAAERRKGTT